MAEAETFRGRKLSREWVQLQNAAAGRGIDVAWDKQLHRLEFPLSDAPTPAELSLTAKIGPSEAPLEVSGLDSVPSVRDLLGGARWSDLPAEIQPMVIESALRPMIELLERSLATSVVLGPAISLPPGSVDPADELPLAWQFTSRTGTAVRGQVLLNRAAAGMIRQALERLPPSATLAVDALPIPAAVTVGATSLTVAELRSLQPFDVVLVEEPFGPPPDGSPGQGCRLVLSDRYQFPATLTPQTLTIASPMAQPEQPPTAASAAPAVPVDELPVRLTFDVGSLELTVGELRTLNAGYVFELDRPIERPVTVKANGRPVATGELVQIGDRVGVRLLELSLPAES